MKKKIGVCCEDMLHAIAVGYITPRIDKGLMAVRAEQSYPLMFAFCPWCAEKLPFPYEEAE